MSCDAFLRNQIRIGKTSDQKRPKLKPKVFNILVISKKRNIKDRPKSTVTHPVFPTLIMRECN